VRGNSSTSRALNRRLILNLLRRHGPVSRAEIANITGLSPAAVTFVVAELVEETLIVEREALSGATGRRPVPIDINYEAHLAFGFKLNADGIDCVLTDLATNPLVIWHAPISDTSPAGMIKAISEAMPQMLAESGRLQSEVMGIGVSIPGEVDVSSGICRRSPRFGWHDLPFGELLGEHVHVPTWIDDDISAFAVAQKLFGAGRDRRNFVALAVGTGIGTALIINGEIYRGARNVAGRFGHITSVPGGRLCECGRHGCLMAHAAEPYMLEVWRAGRGTMSVSRADFVSAVEAGVPDAISILEEAGTRIGHHLADLVNLFDPEVIVVGGEAVQFGETLIGPIRRAMEERVFFSKPELLPDWVPGSWARGAAALATQGIFDFERSPSG